MTLSLGRLLIVAFALTLNVSVWAQEAAPPTTPDPTNSSVVTCDSLLETTLTKNVTAAFRDRDNSGLPNRPSAVRGMQSWAAYLCLVASEPAQAKLLSEAEENRMDKQPGATSSSSGSTSLTSKGSSPSLLGFALEHGGLTQSTSGTTITFRGNVINSITALLDSTYLGSYKLSQSDPIVKYLSHLSFGVSFDTSANPSPTTVGFAPDNKNFSGFSVKYDLYNHRDSRDPKWLAKWGGLSTTAASRYIQPLATFDTVVALNPRIQETYNQWLATITNDIANLPDQPGPDDTKKVVDHGIALFKQLFSNVPEIKEAGARAADALGAYVDAKNSILSQIRNTPIVTLEYNLNRQLTTNDKTITATQPNQKIPDLSNLNLVLERGFASKVAPELTLNVSGTWFNSPNTADLKRGRVRDFRASLEADWHLTALAKLHKPTLSVSGQYLNLVAEPLGQKVTLNGVSIVRRGPMELFQAKLSIPLGTSGVKIPLSLAYASRTDLVKESDVRGNIGITFDLDTLFSKAK